MSSETFLNEVTLDCLINREQYNKYIANKEQKEINRKDQKFYRKRVYNLTKELLLSKEKPLYLFPDVKHAFDHFVNTCIHYFKTIDKSDIIQSDYQDINDLSSIQDLDVSDIYSKEEADKLLMKTIQMPNTLDNFIQKKVTKPQKEMIIPKQKKINLKDPSLKLKGIPKSSKKKNITTIYEENNEKKEKEPPENT
jgi:hypothetical protein